MFLPSSPRVPPAANQRSTVFFLLIPGYSPSCSMHDPVVCSRLSSPQPGGPTPAHLIKFNSSLPRQPALCLRLGPRAARAVSSS